MIVEVERLSLNQLALFQRDAGSLHLKLRLDGGEADAFYSNAHLSLCSWSLLDELECNRWQPRRLKRLSKIR